MTQNRRVQYLAAFAVSLAIMANSIAFFWAAPILPKFYSNEIIPNITKSEISWIVTILNGGMLIGGLVASKVADNFGRRVTVLTSTFPYVIGTVCILCAKKVWMIYIGRILWGGGAGMVSTVSSIYLSEISDKEIRGSLTAATRFIFSLGVFLTVAVGSFMSYKTLTSLLIILPACYFTACWWIPESPYYLLKAGKVDAAKEALLKFSGFKDEKMIEERLSSMRSDVRRETVRSGSVKELLTGKQYRRAIIVSAGLRVTQLMTGTIVINQYLSSIIEQSHCGIKISTVFVIFGVVRFVVSLTAPLVVDKIGRRPLLMYTFTAASVFLAIVGSYFFIQQIIGIDNEATSPLRYIVFIGIIFVMIISNYGFDTLIFIVPSEIFPLNVKSTAMTLFNVFTAFVTFIALRAYQIMEDFIGLQGIFWFYASMAFSGAMFTYFIVPETKGKSLREIQIELQGDIYFEADERLTKEEMVDGDEINTELKEISSKDSR